MEEKIVSINRLHSLDYLRGLMAFGIMCFHLLGDKGASTVITRVGVYGVPIFYILSGLTLNHVYCNSLKINRFDITNFYIKRGFRIFPLLWLAIMLTIIFRSYSWSFKDLFLNITGLFSIINIDSYIAKGSWSIGNELAFYSIFPILVILNQKSHRLNEIILGISLIIFLYFSFVILTPDRTLEQQWITYINPLNQSFFFIAGFTISHFFKQTIIQPRIIILLLLSGIVVLLFAPGTGNRIHLVTGYNRLIYTTACILICIAFYKMNFSVPKYLHTNLKSLGESSYSLYLIHPTVIVVVKTILPESQPGSSVFYFYKFVSILLVLIFSVILSRFIYKYFEIPFINIGKKYAMKKRPLIAEANPAD